METQFRMSFRLNVTRISDVKIAIKSSLIEKCTLHPPAINDSQVQSI